MALDITQQKMYEQIAHMELMDTPQVHIAAATRLSESRISQILQEAEYMEIRAAVAAKTAHEHKELNDRYHTIEMTATKNVIDILKYNRDPDFNLKAAIMANRADRRGGQVKAIQSQHGMRATITMPTVMVQMIKATNNTLVIQQRESSERAKNKFDVMLPGRVEQILDTTTSAEDALASILPEKLKVE
jgi:hypothetical protein